MIITSKSIIIKCLYEKLEASLYQNMKLVYFIAKVLDGDGDVMRELSAYLTLQFTKNFSSMKSVG